MALASPLGGVVSEINVEPGQDVSRSATIMTVLDPTVVEVDGVVDEIDVLSIRVGATANVIMDALPGQEMLGAVSYIAPTPSNQQGIVTYAVRIQVALPPGTIVREGLTAIAQLVVNSEPNVLLAPIQAIRGSFDRPTVLVSQDGVLVERPVTTGSSDEFWVVVSEGLSEGELVVMESVGGFDFGPFGFGPGGGFGGGRGGGYCAARRMTAMIRLEDVTKIYSMGSVEVAALRGISLTIERGEMVAIMGPSGSGKSTLMNVLGCLDVPTSGRYFLEDEEVGLLGDNRLASIRNKKIGFVFQTYNLLARASALANVELPLLYGRERDRRRRSLDALARVGLADRVSHKPPELSGGQQQRVGIARALVKNPAIILADEPTGNLDSKSSLEIMAILSDLNRNEGHTVIIVTHERETAEQTGRIISMLDGLVVSDNRTATPHDAGEAVE